MHASILQPRVFYHGVKNATAIEIKSKQTSSGPSLLLPVVVVVVVVRQVINSAREEQVAPFRNLSPKKMDKGTRQFVLALFLLGIVAVAWASQDAAPGFMCQFRVEAEMGESCERLASIHGVATSDILKWNTDCRFIRMGDPVCVLAVPVPREQVDNSRRRPADAAVSPSRGSQRNGNHGGLSNEEGTHIRDSH
ncbi:hypothetical protein BV898_05014 [Hypsibius exemplaris]|uniref:LysM domain-containing protein n=1 Tax=Hypsibius exemplaris TaxID=2072580 RepID=A0A1W0X0E9_HYPEX|nr:hypothetical protein BV898_05014 [Hypsibius exemplaris]